MTFKHLSTGMACTFPIIAFFLIYVHILCFSAGYRMMSVTDPALTRRVTLRHTIAQIPLAILLPWLEVTNWWFFLESIPLNVYFSYLAWRFYQDSNNQSARKLFRFSLIHLPILMGLILLNKKRHKEEQSETVNDSVTER